jgi:hypothetical protein
MAGKGAVAGGVSSPAAAGFVSNPVAAAKPASCAKNWRRPVAVVPTQSVRFTPPS